MKGHIDIYRPLLEVVNDALWDCQLSQHEQGRFLRFGQKYAEECHFDHLRDIRSVEVNLTPWKAIELPVDAVDWVAVGIQNGNDVMTFINDKKQALLFDKVNGVKQPLADPSYASNLSDIPIEAGFTFPFLNYSMGAGKIFGLRVHDNGLGYVTENRNKDSNELQFKFTLPSTVGPIYLTYISNLWDPKEETLIHPYFAEYIVAGIKREYYGHRPGEGQLLDFAQKEFDRQYLKLLDRSWDLTVEDVLEMIKNQWTMTPKIP